MRIAVVSLAALGLALAACGNTDEKRAATGGLAGAGTGLLVGGPVGAVVGAAAGGLGGAALDEGADTKAERAVSDIKNDHGASSDITEGSGASSRSSAKAKTADVRRAQEALKERGLYTAEVDGRMGPKTKQALREFQRREGLPQTATLDSRTMQRLAGASAARSGSATGAAPGSTTASGAGSTGAGAYAGGTAAGGGTASGMGGAADGSAAGSAGGGGASR
jgi:peptidoglycan hydrolase-like protein with peptidoglycan-binding domain